MYRNYSHQIYIKVNVLICTGCCAKQRQIWFWNSLILFFLCPACLINRVVWLAWCVHYITTTIIIANRAIVCRVIWFFHGMHTTKVLFHIQMFQCRQVFIQKILKITSTRVGYICTYYILPMSMYQLFLGVDESTLPTVITQS